MKKNQNQERCPAVGFFMVQPMVRATNESRNGCYPYVYRGSVKDDLFKENHHERPTPWPDGSPNSATAGPDVRTSGSGGQEALRAAARRYDARQPTSPISDISRAWASLQFAVGSVPLEALVQEDRMIQARKLSSPSARPCKNSRYVKQCQSLRGRR